MLFFINYLAGVAELVDALVLGTSGESRGGSSPSARTIGACMYIDGVMAWREMRRRNAYAGRDRSAFVTRVTIKG